MISEAFLYKSIIILLITLTFLIIYYLINIGNTFIPYSKRIRLKDKKILSVALGLLCFFVLYYLFKKYSILSDTLYTIIFSAILAYILNPLVNYLEQKGVKRVYGVLILYLIILGCIMILAFLIVPKSSREIKRLAVDMPKYIENISGGIDYLYDKYYLTIGGLPDIFQGVQQIVMENLIGIEEMVVNGLKNFFLALINVFSKVVSLILTPILTFYFLVDKEYFLNKIKKLIPKNQKQKTLDLLRDIDISLSKFVRGKIILAAAVGVATSIMLLILGVDFALFIGFITAIADVIPYIGPFIGFVPAFFFALVMSPIKALWVAIFFVFIQWLQNNILAPKIIGDTTGIHPMVILFSIIIGGGIFGVLGMILSVPVVAISVILFDFIKKEIEYRRNRV